MVTRYRLATDLESWRHDPRIAARGFTHSWSSVVADGNGEDFFLELVADYFGPERDVLDVGCGHGELTMLAAERCRSAVGVERVADYIALARELAAERGERNVRFECAELAGPSDDHAGGRLPLPDGSVDLVIDRRGPSIQRFIDDLYRVARPGTVIVGMHPAGGPPAPEWVDEVPAFKHRFDAVPRDIVEKWVTQPAKERGIDSYRLWWIDVPESLPSPRALYDRLKDPTTPPFSQLGSDLTTVFQRYTGSGGVRLRHQRLVFTVEL